ncbi:hypothetical protein Vadar_010026 [Vaccinium darrowii]|uniref:Uncharacterized protein n=1 Tax=Vaccinium darrowii TaxID=229202 RepID=A0ACB7WZG1_9ERIC|nr:hypothetical protein Vadar_010026 [Vaccinium darrowii]
MEEDNQNSEAEEEGEDEHRVHVGTGVEVGGGDREAFEGWSERLSIKHLLTTLVKDQGSCGIQHEGQSDNKE